MEASSSSVGSSSTSLYIDLQFICPASNKFKPQFLVAGFVFTKNRQWLLPMKNIENEQFKILYTSEAASFVKRKDTYVSNMGNAYELLFGQCSKAMQSKLQSRNDLEVRIKGNPVELLSAIQEHSISYVDHQYEMSNILDAIVNLFTLNQKDDESLLDYTGRFKSAKDILDANLGGTLILTKYIQFKMENGEETDESKLQLQAYEQLFSYMYIRQSDRKKYGTLVDGLSTQFSLGQDQYPKTILDASNVLSNHPFDATYIENKKKTRDKEQTMSNHSNQDNINQEEIPQL
jgi:hypothetical protein